MAYEMIKAIKEVNHREGIELNMRIGIHTGDVIAGITGRDVVRYDIYGSAVMVANKMERGGAPGKINVSEIQQLIEKTGGELLDSTWLFDVYTGQGVEDGKRSLAFALLWQHPSRNLDDAEIKYGKDHILKVLENTYQAPLRAS